MKQTKLFTSLLAMLLMLMPVSMMAAWSYTASGNVLSAYGESGYTAQSPLSITLNAPADLQFNGTYKPATISNTDAWTAAGLTVPTILYDGKTNAPSMLGTYTASISAGGATAEVVYTIKTVIDYQSFFHNGLTQGINYDIVPGTGKQQVALNNSENRGVYWDPVENCAVFDGEAYLQIDSPLGDVTAETGFTLTMDVWISSENNGNGYFYRSTGAYVKKSGWQRLFDLSDGHEEDCIFINAGNANNGTAHLMWCLRKGYGNGQLEVWNNTDQSFYNQWCTITMVVAPGGYTTLYVNGEVLTHSSSSDIPKITNVLNYISGYDKCYIGTSIFEAGGGNADGFFFGKIRGFQTAEGALMPYYDGTNYHYLLSYETNGGNPITGTFEATIPTTLPTPTHSVAGASFQGWFLDEALTIPVTTGVALTQNTSLYAKWNYMVGMAEGTEDVARWSVYPTSAPEGATITVNYIGSRNVESIEIGNTHTYYVNTTADLATALANFNANPGSRLVLNVDVTTMTITADEGVIDLNGHKVTNASSFFLQNNTLGKAITIKNGTVQGIDGNGGWADTYYGTVILENIYLPGDLYTDGHAFILNSGTYNKVQNYKKGDKPGTVTVYRGVRIVTRNSVNSSASQNGATSGTYIDLSEDAPVSPGVTEVVPNAQWTFSMPAHNADVIVNYSDYDGHGTEDDPYLIPSTEVWNKLVDNVNNAAHNYANKYFRQTADISVSTMLGYRVNDNAFRTFNGIYDGYGHTLNVTINGSETFCAPFHCIANATIKNLVVTGTVSVSAATILHPSGLVGVMVGTCALENCLVSTNVSGSRYMGGLIGHSRQANYTITGCVYNGTLTTSGNYYAGGLTGWGGATSNSATITDCLFAGTYVGSAKFHPVGCFDGNTRAISNMYYTQAPSGGMTDGETHSFVRTTSYKGERVYSVTAGTGVTITPVGTPVTSYNVSKLDLYETDGIAFNGVRYGGQGDMISMNLSGAEQYMASTGTLNGTENPYSLTMAAANSVISKVVASVTTSANVTTNYNDFSAAVSAWESNSTLKLLADVEYGSTIEINNTRILDLNGYGIKRTGTGRVILLNGSGNLTINDSNPDAEHKFTVTNAYGDAGLGVVNDELTSGYQTFHGGYITGGNGVEHGAGIENDATNGVVTINGGVFIGNRSTTHGGFYWGHTNKTLNMNGGRIIYNMTACQGAAIFIGNASMRLYGGEISHNYSTGSGRAHSGGICSAGNNNFYMHGAPIVTANIGGNSATNQPNDICLESMIRIDEEMTNTTPIGIMMNLGGYNGQTRGQFSFESAYVTNETVAKFTPQNYSGDEIVRIGNALWVWNSVLDTQGSVFYQVTYDSRGGSAVAGQKVLAGTTAAQPANPTKPGHTFAAWYKDVWFTEAWDFANDVVNADITLYARYTDETAFSISINAPTTATNGWYLIASPIGAVSPSSVNNMTSNTFDIFRFNQNPTATGSLYLEWENWNDNEPGETEPRHFDLEPGRGYLYANNNDVTLKFVGAPYSGDGKVTLVRSNSNSNTDDRMLGWNLIGNPFGVTATIEKSFYRMNNTNTDLMPADNSSVAPMEGIFVHTETDGEIVTFATGSSKGNESNANHIVINLSSGSAGTVIDRAIVSFEEGRTLPKFQINESSTKLYIPQNGADYAIAFSDRTGEMPLNFKAAKNGSYTLTVDAEGAEVVYLHLIDNMTGADVDLLAQPSYTFTSKTTDYESRFKLVFGANGPSTGSGTDEPFAFFANGEWIILTTSSEASTLQVIDIMGRVLLSEEVYSAFRIPHSAFTTPGVYVLRLINATETKTQKIVVEQ